MALEVSRLDSVLGEAEAGGFSGVLLVGVGGAIEFLEAVGWRDRTADRRLRGDDVFSIGSITKQFTAAAVLKGEELGLLSVGDYLVDYFDEVPQDKRLITIHHLLTHTSGLRSDFAEDFDTHATREWYVGAALASPLLGPVGAAFAYSNAGYSLVAAILEMVSGKGYEQFLAEQVLEPAGLTETGYLLPQWAPDRLVHGYENDRDWGTIVDKPWDTDGPYWALRGNGGIHSTAPDMFNWHIALGDDQVLNPAQRKRFMCPYVLEQGHYEAASGMPFYYSYGWALRLTDRHTRLVRHDGGDGIFLATFRRYIDEGVLIYMASSVAEHPCSELADRVEAAVFG